jgi:hypothetical protein
VNEKFDLTGLDCVCEGAIIKREVERHFEFDDPKDDGQNHVVAVTFYCQTCGIQYDGPVMTRRMAEHVSPIEDAIMQAALQAEQELETNPEASLADIGAAAKGNFVVSIPPVKKGQA